MRPIAFYLGAFHVLISSAEVQEEDCSIVTRTIARITSLEYHLVPNYPSHIKQHLTKPTNYRIGTSPPESTSTDPDGLQSRQYGSNTDLGSSAAPKSQIVKVSHPGTGSTTIKSCGQGSQGQARTSPRSLTRPSCVPTKSSPQSRDRSIESPTMSTSSYRCPAPPPGFYVVCGQRPGQDSVIERKLRKRATVSSDYCANTCTADDFCAGAAYDNDDGSCTLYSSLAPLVPGRSFNTFVKSTFRATSSAATSAGATQTPITSDQSLNSEQPAPAPGTTNGVTQKASGSASNPTDQQHTGTSSVFDGSGRAQGIPSSSSAMPEAPATPSWAMFTASDIPTAGSSVRQGIGSS